MKEQYTFEYVNEKEFKMLERSLKKYNMLAFKKLYFEYYPALKEGDFLGEKVSKNVEKGTETFELKLPTDIMFSRVYETFKLHYIVNTKEKVITLVKITPEEILLEGHQTELTTYKGVLLSKKNASTVMFKIDLLNMVKK